MIIYYFRSNFVFLVSRILLRKFGLFGDKFWPYTKTIPIERNQTSNQSNVIKIRLLNAIIHSQSNITAIFKFDWFYWRTSSIIDGYRTPKLHSSQSNFTQKFTFRLRFDCIRQFKSNWSIAFDLVRLVRCSISFDWHLANTEIIENNNDNDIPHKHGICLDSWRKITENWNQENLSRYSSGAAQKFNKTLREQQVLNDLLSHITI